MSDLAGTWKFIARESEESVLRPGYLRLGLELSLRMARRVVPHPGLWARVAGASIPTRFIAGPHTRLFRPESVAFSPSGALMAVSNSGRHSVCLYAKADAQAETYEAKPHHVISDPECLRYVHDTAFSPCGKYLAAVGEESHALAMYDLTDLEEDGEARLLWCVRGDAAGLSYPAGVAFHPSGQWLAVANRERTGITLHRRSGSGGYFETTPFQMITTGEDLRRQGLGAPHGLDFSPDGRFLIATHKRFWLSDFQQGESGLSVFECRPEPDSGLEPEPSYVLRCGRTAFHLVAFHPSGELVAVSNSMHGIDVFRWSRNPQSLTRVDTLPIFRVREGAKGVAFTRDGEQLVVTTDLNEVLFFDCIWMD